MTLDQTITTFDFGHGPIPAHRHTNPDGTVGGWVADTASVSPTAWIGDGASIGVGASIGDRARIGVGASIGDGATIGDRARIGVGASIGNGARIGVGASIANGAMIGDGARIGVGAMIGVGASIETSRHHLLVGPVGSESRTVTIHHTTDGGHVVQAGCWSGTLDDLAERIAGDPWDGDERGGVWRADYEGVIALARVRVAEWATAEVTAA